MKQMGSIQGTLSRREGMRRGVVKVNDDRTNYVGGVLFDVPFVYVYECCNDDDDDEHWEFPLCSQLNILGSVGLINLLHYGVDMLEAVLLYCEQPSLLSHDRILLAQPFNGCLCATSKTLAPNLSEWIPNDASTNSFAVLTKGRSRKERQKMPKFVGFIVTSSFCFKVDGAKLSINTAS